MGLRVEPLAKSRLTVFYRRQEEVIPRQYRSIHPGEPHASTLLK